MGSKIIPGWVTEAFDTLNTEGDFAICESHESMQLVTKIADQIFTFLKHSAYDALKAFTQQNDHVFRTDKFEWVRLGKNDDVFNSDLSYRIPFSHMKQYLRLSKEELELFDDMLTQSGGDFAMFFVDSAKQRGTFTAPSCNIGLYIDSLYWKKYKNWQQVGTFLTSILNDCRARATIIHEVAHAYDYFVSQHKALGRLGDPSKQKQSHQQYLRMPHEINARFYSAVAEASEYKLACISTQKQLRYQFDKYEERIRHIVETRELTPKQRQNIMRRAGKEFGVLSGNEIPFVAYRSCQTILNNNEPNCVDYRIGKKIVLEYARQSLERLANGDVDKRFLKFDKYNYSDIDNIQLMHEVWSKDSYDSALALGAREAEMEWFHALYEHIATDHWDPEYLQTMLKLAKLPLSIVDDIRAKYSISEIRKG